jgi:hypothetical protein
LLQIDLTSRNRAAWLCSKQKQTNGKSKQMASAQRAAFCPFIQGRDTHNNTINEKHPTTDR